MSLQYRSTKCDCVLRLLVLLLQELPTVEWMKMQREMLMTGVVPAQT